MEFPKLIPLSQLFPDRIAIVGRDLIPFDSPAVKKYGDRTVVEQMSEILNKVGVASAKAQGLHSDVTTAENFHNLNNSSSGRQVVYILSDFNNNTVLGMLKIGVKHLFLYDEQGQIHELHPTCILDFYIHESVQRRGYGKILFDAMLKHEQINVRHLATDLPSDKLIFFYRKHYNLNYVIPQTNHFAIYEGFFDGRDDLESGRKAWHGLDQIPDKALPKTTGLQDSREYNDEVLIHYRNKSHGRFAAKENCIRNGNGTTADQPDSSFY